METANEKKWRLKSDGVVRQMKRMDRVFKERVKELEEEIERYKRSTRYAIGYANAEEHYKSYIIDLKEENETLKTKLSAQGKLLREHYKKES